MAGERRATHEVHLAADAAVEPRADGLRADLAGEINLDGAIDRDHALELANDERVVGVVGGPHLDHRVVVYEVQQTSRAHDKARHNPPWVALLARAGDDAALDEIEHTIGEHLGMHAQVAPVSERLERRVRNRADAELQGRAILDQLGDIASRYGAVSPISSLRYTS